MPTVSIIRKFGENEIAFPKLSKRECVNISNRLFEQGRAKLLKDLDDAKANPEAREAALAKYRDLEGTPDQLLKHCRTLEGATEVLGLSIARLNGNAPDLDALDMPQGMVMELALLLCNFVFVTKEEDEANDGFDRPQNRATG